MNRALFNTACAVLFIAPQALQAHDRAAAAAAKDAPAVVKDENIPPANMPPYVLKNRSKFNDPGETARVPFWPVGWSKQKQGAIAVAVAAPEQKISFDEKSFRVTSILISSGTAPSLAVINGRAYGEGEFLRMPKGVSARSRIRVERINDGTVTLGYEDQKIVTPLRRPELNQHKSDDEMLDPNR